MRSMLSVILALTTLLTVTGCSNKETRGEKEFTAAPALVVIYGKLNKDDFGDVYYGEDTRGRMYVIEKGKFNLDFTAQPAQFVKIADYKGKWYIERVLANAPEVI